jgi:hypothetical protein
LKKQVLRVLPHKLDTMLLEDIFGIVVRSSFDYCEPSLEFLVSEAAWAEAGYGGPLSGLSAEERQTLYAAILTGIRLVEHEGKRRLEVHLAPAPAEGGGACENAPEKFTDFPFDGADDSPVSPDPTSMYARSLIVEDWCPLNCQMP